VSSCAGKVAALFMVYRNTDKWNFANLQSSTSAFILGPVSMVANNMQIKKDNNKIVRTAGGS
jgi:hypothetical protein